MKKSIALILVLVVALGLLAGCGGKGNTGGGGGGGSTFVPSPPPAGTDSETPLRIQWYQSIGVNTLFEGPHVESSLSLATPMIWSSMGYYDAVKADYVKTIAKDYGHNENYTEWWITMNDGVTWHDGEPVTIDDLYFSVFNAILNPNSRAYLAFEDVKGYREMRETTDGTQDSMENCEIEGIYIDGDKLCFKLIASRPTFYTYMLSVYLLPSHILGGETWADVDLHDYWRKPIGCGPYQIEEVKFPDYFTMTRYDGYFGKPAGIKNVECINYSTGGSDAVVAAMINEQLDYVNRTAIMDRVMADSVVAQNPNVRALAMPGFGIRAFVFNMGERQDGKVKDDLKKKEVRQAFDLLMDQESIAYLNQCTPTYTISSAAGYDYNTDLVRPAYDVEAAKKLLDEANFDYSKTYDIAYYYTDQTSHDTMALIKQQFAAAGVKIDYKCYTESLNDVIYNRSNFDMLYIFMAASGEMPCGHIGSITSGGTFSYMGAKAERAKYIDPLFNKYRTATTKEERAEISKQIQAANFEQCFVLACYSMTNYCAYNTTTLYIPEEVFSVDGNGNFRFEDWRILG